jgi:ATP-dependent HslUV protease subunit HslV
VIRFASAVSRLRQTTVLFVRRDGRAALAGDGQVTLGQTIVKASAAKVRRLGRKRQVLAGFAGGAADGMALLARFEDKLEASNQNLERAAVELARDWRTDRTLRQLEAMLIVADQERAFLLSGQGDLLQPDPDEPLAVGSGMAPALAAARALLRFTSLPASEIARRSLEIAAELCIYTNQNIVVEEL